MIQRSQTRSTPQEWPPQPRSEDARGKGTFLAQCRAARPHSPAGLDPAFTQRIAELARLIAGPQVSGERFLIACRIACAQIDVMRARRARADLLSRGFYVFGQTNPKRSGGRKTMWPKEPVGAARSRISQTNPTDYGAALWPTEPDAQPRAFLWPNDPRDRPLVDLFPLVSWNRFDELQKSDVN